MTNTQKRKKEKVTKQEAKKITLDIWRFFADHPDRRNKTWLPQHLVAKIAQMKNHCPLCELYHKPEPPCPGCPLGDCAAGSLYAEWTFGTCEAYRQAAAKAIVEKIQAWETGE